MKGKKPIECYTEFYTGQCCEWLKRKTRIARGATTGHRRTYVYAEGTPTFSAYLCRGLGRP